MTNVAVRREKEREALRAGWRASGWYSDLTVGEALAAGSRDHPEGRLVFAQVDGAVETTTLGTLHARAVGLSSGLHNAGVVPGSVLVVQAPADRASTEVLEALWLLGAVVVPVVLTAGRDELDRIVVDAEATHLLVAPEWRGEDLETRAVEIQRARGLAATFVIGDHAGGGGVPTSWLDRDGSVATVRSAPASVCCVLYTSGSTAAPKGVQHTHETLLAGLTAVPAGASTRTLAAFPAGHVASLLGLLRPLCVGGSTVVMDRWSARVAVALIEEHRLDTSAGTPFFLRTLLDEADRSGCDISSLQRFLVGAATVPPALVERAETRGIVSWRTYGSTEHPAITTGTPADPPEKRRLTDGRPGPGNEVRLLDERGRDVPRGEQGEIVARGPKQFLGYRTPALDAEAFVDTSWFRTGDLGRFDDDGYLVVTDRLKDIIIRGGENISAREVEDVLASNAHVREVAVCGAPDDTWGETVCAFVLPADGPPPTLDDLASYAASRGLAAHKMPAKLVVVDEMPRTSAGKIRKQDLRRRIESTDA